MLDDWLLNQAFHRRATSLHYAGTKEALPVQVGHFGISCAMDFLLTHEHAFPLTTNISVPGMRLRKQWLNASIDEIILMKLGSVLLISTILLNISEFLRVLVLALRCSERAPVDQFRNERQKK